MQPKPINYIIESLIKSPFSRILYIKELLPKMELIHMYAKYDNRYQSQDHQIFRDNLEILLYLQGIKSEDLSVVTGMSKERIDYLTNESQQNTRNNNECNLDIEDYILLGVWLTAHTGHSFERIFEKDFKIELKEYGLMARS